MNLTIEVENDESTNKIYFTLLDKKTKKIIDTFHFDDNFCKKEINDLINTIECFTNDNQKLYKVLKTIFT
jgi:hypothetical protein